jgi:hypothetical protein
LLADQHEEKNEERAEDLRIASESLTAFLNHAEPPPCREPAAKPQCISTSGGAQPTYYIGA